MFIGVYVLAVIGIQLLVFFSNKVMDSIPDVLYAPTSGAAVGYMALMIASSKAIGVSDNHERTTRIIWIIHLILSSIIILYGLFQLVIGIVMGLEIFNLDAAFPHWLYILPLGLGGLIAAFQVKRGGVWFD